MNLKNTKSLLHQLNLRPQKKLGQNFLIDDNLISKICDIAEIDSGDAILEIGPGLGSLTSRLLKLAHSVIAYEIDHKLYKFLLNKFKKSKNLILCHQDILEANLMTFNKVVSNIPYSITGPIFEKVFFNDDPPIGIMIIEQSLAKRIFHYEIYKNFSRISIMVNSYLDPIIEESVSRNAFYPHPQIPLSLIKLLPKKNPYDFLKNIEKRNFYSEFVAGIMPYKNKNCDNAIELFFKGYKNGSLSKTAINKTLNELNLKDLKLSQVQIEIFPNLAEMIYNQI